MHIGQGLGRAPSPPEERAVYATRYALAAPAIPEAPTPVVIGVPWYAGAYEPTVDRDGIAWLRTSDLTGGVVGGHALCLLPEGLDDPEGAHAHYDQGREGACVGFAWSRAASLVEGRLFDGFSLYRRARQVDEWPGEAYDGTSVNAGGRVCKDEGLWLVRGGRVSKRPSARWRIGSFRWAPDLETVLRCLKIDPNRGYLEYLQSWGLGHPRRTRMELEVADRLIFREDGDAAIAANEPGRPGAAG